MTLLVSIHDVTPAYAAEATRLWDMCVRHAVKPALLVVPDWHGMWPIERHSRFAGWLRARADEGAEIVLHGERHDEAGLRRSTADRMRAWGKTDGEGEFRTLDETAARERIESGMARLRRVGLRPLGFVPPAWLAREDAHRAAAAAGLAFSEDDTSIRLLAAGCRLRSPVVRWSSRTPARAIGSVAVALGRWILQRGARFPRLAFHPQDLSHPATGRSLEPTLVRWLGRHQPAGYAEVLSAVIA